MINMTELSSSVPKFFQYSPIRRQQPHPLRLQTVLEVLFEKCDLETLKVARKVCKQWLDISTFSFRRKSVINFYSMYPDTYIDLMYSIERYSYSFIPINVALTLSPMYGESLYYNRNLTVCPWHACEECIFPYGESIESLKFYAWDSVSEKLNASLFSQILLTPKRLRSLEISLLPSRVASYPLFPYPWESRPPLYYLTTLIMYGRVDCTEKFLFNFLSATPNVRTITVNCCSEDFLDLFCETLFAAPLCNVEHLKLNFVSSFTDNQLRNIAKAKFPLRTLHTAPRTWVTTFDEFERLLTQVASTLEDVKLTVCTKITTHEQYISIPFLPQLRFLRLQSWRGGPGFWDMSFLNSMPNLESLIMERRGLFAPIHNPDEQMMCYIKEDDVMFHANLKNLVLPSMPLMYPHRKSLKSLLGKFPNLTRLTLSCNDACFECVCQNAAQLEELTIAEYSKITDDGITGLLSGGDLSESKNCNGCNIRLGITALKDLKRLELDGFWGHITDFSLKHGIMHLPKLDSVILRGCKISEWGQKTLSNMHLTVVGHDTFHIFEPEPLEDIIV